MLTCIAGYDPEFGRGNDMFKDIALSKDLMEEYRLSKGDKDERMTAMVLKFSTWPYSKSDGTINLPVEVCPRLKVGLRR